MRAFRLRGAAFALLLLLIAACSSASPSGVAIRSVATTESRTADPRGLRIAVSPGLEDRVNQLLAVVPNGTFSARPSVVPEKAPADLRISRSSENSPSIKVL